MLLNFFFESKNEKKSSSFLHVFFKLLLKNTYSYVYKKRKKKKLNDKCLVHDVSVNPYTKSRMFLCINVEFFTEPRLKFMLVTLASENKNWQICLNINLSLAIHVSCLSSFSLSFSLPLYYSIDKKFIWLPHTHICWLTKKKF